MKLNSILVIRIEILLFYDRIIFFKVVLIINKHLVAEKIQDYSCLLTRVEVEERTCPEQGECVTPPPGLLLRNFAFSICMFSFQSISCSHNILADFWCTRLRIFDRSTTKFYQKLSAAQANQLLQKVCVVSCKGAG